MRGEGWKKVETTKVKLARGTEEEERRNYRHGEVEFNVLWKRDAWQGNLSMAETDKEAWAIENKLMGLWFEGKTLNEARHKFNEWLEGQTENLSEGRWELWAHVTAHGYAHPERDNASVSLGVEFYAHHIALDGKVRHMGIRELPRPFIGEWEKPKKRSDVAKLQSGLPECAKSDTKDYKGWSSDSRRPRTEDEMETYVEATPEMVETMRHMQKRLAEIGEEIKRRLHPKNFQKTLEAVRAGQSFLLGPGAK